MRGRRRFLVPVGLVALGLLLLTSCDPLVIDQPALYTTQPSATITGTVGSRSGDTLTSVVVNGVTATLNGMSFSAVIPVGGGSTFIPVVAVAHFASGFSGEQRSTVGRANGTTVTLVDKDATITDGVALRLTPSGIAKLGPRLAPAVAFPSSQFAVPPTDLGGPSDVQIVPGGAPVMGGPTVTVDLTSEVLRAVVTYSPFHQFVAVQVQGPNGPESCAIDMAFAPLTGTSLYRAQGAGPDGVRIIQAAAPTSTSTLTVTGCSATATQMSAVPQVVGFVRPYTQGLLAFLLSDTGSGAPLANALQAQLAPLGLSGAIGGSASGITLDSQTSAAGFTTAGLGLTDAVGYHVSTLGRSAPAQSASLAFGATSAGLPAVPADWSLGASTATVNQLLAAITERAQLSRLLTTVGGQPFTFNQLDALVGLGGPISPDRNLRVNVVPTVAPVITDGPATPGDVGVLRVAGLRASVSFEDDGELLLDPVFDADGRAVLQLIGGDVRLRGNSFAATRVDLFANGNPRGLSTGQTNAIVAVLMSSVLAPLVAGTPIMRLPGVSGLGITVTGSGRVGSSVYLVGTYS